MHSPFSKNFYNTIPLSLRRLEQITRVASEHSFGSLGMAGPDWALEGVFMIPHSSLFLNAAGLSPQTAEVSDQFCP